MSQITATDAVATIKELRITARMLDGQRKLFDPKFVPQHIIIDLTEKRNRIAHYKQWLQANLYYIDDDEIDTE